MNNAKIWLVVPPAVGVPLFLTACAVGSLLVHVMIVSNTTWVKRFLEGQPIMRSAVQSPSVASVVLPDGRTASVTVASAETR